MINLASNKSDYYELAVTSNFSFLRGGSHAEELVNEAARLGIKGISINDRNSLAGVVRGHMAAKEVNIKYATGCRLVFMDGTPDILVWPEDRAAYGNLCELLTLGKRRAPKAECHLLFEDFMAHGQGLLSAVLPSAFNQDLALLLTKLKQHFPNYIYLATSWHYSAVNHRHLALSAECAKANKVPLLAVGDVLYHTPERRALQDVLSCIREKKTLQTIGKKLLPNAERHLHTPAEILRLFKSYKYAVLETKLLFNRINFSLDELRYQYPDEPEFEELNEPPQDGQDALEKLTQIGLKRRYPNGPPAKVLKSIAHETTLIKKLNYASYFLTVYDIVRFARSQNILCQGRGSAANSAVCYCLGITEVNPEKVDLLFERFISEERGEPPDIDVDFEHERREEVIQYIYQKYGRERSGLAATVVTYRSRSALRETAKVFGYSDDAITAISSTRWGSSSQRIKPQEAKEAGLDPDDKHLKQMLDLTAELIGFPRHLSQHVGGFVITKDRLSSLIPIENAAMEDRTIVEWDKDDLECLGMLKIDILALGMLTCIRKAFELLKTHYGRSETLASLPDEDSDTYDMICKADTVGVFQVESRAQMSMLPRLRPRTYYDLVIEVAIVRPGPIQGNMVHPYLRRRQGKEKAVYPKEELRQILGKTLGVPLFQEQAMNIAIVAAKLTPSEADKLRRAMATFRRVGTIGSFHKRMVDNMTANGYEREFAEHCFKQIEGFGEYGFPESHAASFALLVYVSCWLKCHYPDVFCAAILNSQPMGFYAPAQLVRDAREHGVEARPIDINHSCWDSTLEQGAKKHPISKQFKTIQNIMQNKMAVRLGFSRIKGIGEEDAQKLCEHRHGGYDSVRDLWMRSGLSRRTLTRLAEADCFRSIGLDRRDALWAVKALDPLKSDERLPLFASADHNRLQHEPEVHLPPMPLGEHVVNDYQTLALSLKAHPMAFLRNTLKDDRYIQNGTLPDLRSGRFVKVAGLVLIRQRPGSAKGVIFATIEDESGVANIIVWPKTFEKFRRILIGSRCIGVRGKLQSSEGVIHVVAEFVEDLTPLTASISEIASLGDQNPLHIQPFKADEARAITPPRSQARKRTRFKNMSLEQKRQVKEIEKTVLPVGRNFH